MGGGGSSPQIDPTSGWWGSADLTPPYFHLLFPAHVSAPRKFPYMCEIPGISCKTRRASARRENLLGVFYRNPWKSSGNSGNFRTKIRPEILGPGKWSKYPPP